MDVLRSLPVESPTMTNISGEDGYGGLFAKFGMLNSYSHVDTSGSAYVEGKDSEYENQLSNPIKTVKGGNPPKVENTT